MNENVILEYNKTNFREVLERELDKLIAKEIESIKIKEIPSYAFCDMYNLEPTDFNGWECAWWDSMSYKQTKLHVYGEAWYASVEITRYDG